MTNYCFKCEGKGFIQSSFVKDSREYPLIQKCECKFSYKYNEEIKRRYSNQNESEQEKINRLLGKD